jgi:hypothetical protein
MPAMTPFMWVLLVWGVVTTVFVILMIYRSLVAMQEDDQLFLNPTESILETEQKEVRNRISRLAPYTKGFGFTSAGLAVVIVGFWIYRGLVQFNAP